MDERMSSPDSGRILTRADVLAAIRPILPVLERLGEKIRIVGTASSMLRHIDLPVGDVDILAKERPIVEELAAAAAAAGGVCLEPTGWMENPGFGQYFTEFELSGVRIAFSTVELPPGEPAHIGECVGDAPWKYFDMIEVEGHYVPVVASELRLFSEVVRSRADRWRQIGAQLEREGYNEELLAAALEALPSDYKAVMKGAVGKEAAGE